jgi:hypothetical protein
MGARENIQAYCEQERASRADYFSRRALIESAVRKQRAETHELARYIAQRLLDAEIPTDFTLGETQTTWYGKRKTILTAMVGWVMFQSSGIRDTSGLSRSPSQNFVADGEGLLTNGRVVLFSGNSPVVSARTIIDLGGGPIASFSETQLYTGAHAKAAILRQTGLDTWQFTRDDELQLSRTLMVERMLLSFAEDKAIS